MLIAPLSHNEIMQLGWRAKAQALIEVGRHEPQIHCPLYHHFLPGLYIRELHIPAGVITVGKIHKHPCLNFLTKGERTTLIGDQLARIKAPFCYWTDRGFQRISETHEDAVWITQHWNPSDERDIATLEAEIAAETEEEFQQYLRFLSMEVEASCPS